MTDDQAQKPECIACKYSGSDEREYAAHGCPDHTCKPDASPREWWIAPSAIGLRTDGRLTLVLGPAVPPDYDLHVIEKSAYDALAKRVAELQIQFEGSYTWTELTEELASAKARVAELDDQLDHEKCRTEHFETLSRKQLTELATANARIKELEVHCEL